MRTRAEIARLRAEAEQAPAAATASTGTAAQAATPHVETAAPGRPVGPAASGRSAVELNSHTMPSAKVSTRIPDPTRRKPPQAVKAAAPKERKITAHRASGG